MLLHKLNIEEKSRRREDVRRGKTSRNKETKRLCVTPDGSAPPTAGLLVGDPRVDDVRYCLLLAADRHP
jgi:hypothetical protein